MRVGAKLVAEDDADFQRFWAMYPKKVAKKDARLAWAHLKPSPALVALILDVLAWQCRQVDWQKAGGMFVPHPGSWLRGERWEDASPSRSQEEPYHWADCSHQPKCGTARECADRKAGRR